MHTTLERRGPSPPGRGYPTGHPRPRRSADLQPSDSMRCTARGWSRRHGVRAVWGTSPPRTSRGSGRSPASIAHHVTERAVLELGSAEPRHVLEQNSSAFAGSAGCTQDPASHLSRPPVTCRAHRLRLPWPRHHLHQGPRQRPAELPRARCTSLCQSPRSATSRSPLGVVRDRRATSNAERFAAAVALVVACNLRVFDPATAVSGRLTPPQTIAGVPPCLMLRRRIDPVSVTDLVTGGQSKRPLLRQKGPLTCDFPL